MEEVELRLVGFTEKQITTLKFLRELFLKGEFAEDDPYKQST